LKHGRDGILLEGWRFIRTKISNHSNKTICISKFLFTVSNRHYSSILTQNVYKI